MLRLADTSFRMYRKRDGNVSLRLRSYLMVAANGTGFRLSTYLSDIAGTLTFASGSVVPLEEIAFADECHHEMGTMVHDFWASAQTGMKVMKDTVAKLRIEYKLFYHPCTGPSSFEVVVPVVRRGSPLQWRSRNV